MPKAMTGPSPREFVALIAMLFATIALSIDAMLPALPAIAAELSPDDVNRAQLVVGVFFAGMGVGTLLAGPISDAIGRKTTLLGCAVIYLIGTTLCAIAPSLELLLFARFIQGTLPLRIAVAMANQLVAPCHTSGDQLRAVVIQGRVDQGRCRQAQAVE